MEKGKVLVDASADSLFRVISALEDAGIEFIDDGKLSVDGGPGLRLKDRVVVSIPKRVW